MDFVKKIGIRKIVLFAIVILFALTIFLIVYNKRDYANVYYRTYTTEKGWTKWSKNGEVNGSDKDIKAIQIKIKSNVKGKLVYSIGSERKWIDKETINATIGDKANNMYMLRLNLSGDLKEKYTLKYRIKTNDGNWTIWGSKSTPLFKINSKTKNNELLPIRKIQINFEKK